MSKLTVKFNLYNFDSVEIRDYLLSLKGIRKIDTDDEKITIEYSNEINIYMIVNEIRLFFKSNCSDIYYFNKHLNNNLSEYNVVIQDLCCEYCLYGLIEDLLYIDGISEVYSNYKEVYLNHNKEDLKVTVLYDKNVIDEEQIKELVNNI